MGDSNQGNPSERFMSGIAIQRADNSVCGIDLVGFVQRLLLFDQCIIPTIWLEDIGILMRAVDPGDLSDLLRSGALKFYVDSSTPAEMGQARGDLNLSGNVNRLKDNEFHFLTIRAHNEQQKIRESLNNLSRTEGVGVSDASTIAELVEENMLPSDGLAIIADAFSGVYADFNSTDTSILERLLDNRLRELGIKPKGVEIRLEEFVPEDFRVHSNLQKFGLTSQESRKVTLRALMDLIAVHSRLAHMRHFSCLIGMNPKEELPWEIKADSLIRMFEKEGARDRQFARVIRLAGLGESALIQAGKIDLRRLMKVRESEELVLFRAWLKESDNKTDKEVSERLRSLRARIGNSFQSPTGKVVRLMISGLSGLIPNPIASLASGFTLSATDSFFMEKLFPKDAIQNLVGKEYPAILKRN